MKTLNKSTGFYLLLLLLIFLPFSSWLISLTGMPNIGLIRDGLVVLIFLSTLKNKRLSLFDKKYIPVLLFVFYVFISYFWTEAGSSQWLRGVRLYFTPLLLMVGLGRMHFGEVDISKINKYIISLSLIIVGLAILELFHIKLPLTSHLSGAGALQDLHLVGAANIVRLQSVLAGPNALGLYLLAVTAFMIAFFDQIKFAKWLIIPYIFILILTFSRSAWLGLFVLLFIYLIIKLKLSAKRALLIVLLLLVAIIPGYFVTKKSATINQIIFHGDSTSLRTEEYRRVWADRTDIGLLGRGAGAAGPSTQSRLDGGPNYWTENTYLDIFEELGMVGLLLFLCIIVSAISIAVRNRRHSYARACLLVLPSFAVAGIFINFFTGQVGIILVFLVIGLMFSQINYEKQPKQN